MILITGLTGMLGRNLKTLLDKKGIEYFALSRDNFNLGNVNLIENTLRGKKFSHFIHLAAETNVDFCETNPSHAYVCNFYATQKIAQYCRQNKAKLIFISTSAVFGREKKIRYCELDTPAPVNIYGQTKFLAEQAIQNICEDYLILRAAWMIGGGEERDNKFVGKLINQLKDKKENISVVCDKMGAITYAKSLAALIVDSLKTDFIGIKHCSSVDFCSRYDIAKLIVKTLRYPCEIIPILSACFPLAATRPMIEAFYSVIPSDIFPSKPYTWSDALISYLKEEFYV